MVGGEIRVTLNLGDIAILQMNQYPTTAMAGATIGLDYLFSGKLTHQTIALSLTGVYAPSCRTNQEGYVPNINRIALYHLRYELLNVWGGLTFEFRPAIPDCTIRRIVQYSVRTSSLFPLC